MTPSKPVPRLISTILVLGSLTLQPLPADTRPEIQRTLKAVTDINLSLPELTQHRNQPAPPPKAIESFPDYGIVATIERQLEVTPAQAAAVLLAYNQQCETCKYFVRSVVKQEIYERENNPHQFLVWQNINKELQIPLKKLRIMSSSWTQIRVFEEADQSIIIIDSKLLEQAHAQRLAIEHSRPSKPAFAMLHSRWSITALDPIKHQGKGAQVTGIAGGTGQGLTTVAPKHFLRKELKAVMSETLNFIPPSRIP